MNDVYKYVDDLVVQYPEIGHIKKDILSAYLCLEESFRKGGKLLVAGNGGSAADAEHITGELMKGFKLSRKIPEKFTDELKKIDPSRWSSLQNQLQEGLMTIPLVNNNALITAYLNDVTCDGVFAQQVYGYGKPGDVFLAISTSGNSENIVKAAVVAKALGMRVISLSGDSGGELKLFSDISICVPRKETYKIQELHLPIYHCLCLMLEEAFFG